MSTTTSEVVDAPPLRAQAGSRHLTHLFEEHEMTSTTDPAYPVAYLRDVTFGPAIVSYLDRIDATLEPFGGEFVVHGGQLSPLEGTWDGDLVVIRFPDRRTALDWYASPAYQEILPLRLEHTRSMATVVDGVPPGYRAEHGPAAKRGDVSQDTGSRR